MLEPGRASSFVQESLHLARTRESTRPQNLDRDNTLELQIPCSINSPKRVSAQLFENLELTGETSALERASLGVRASAQSAQ